MLISLAAVRSQIRTGHKQCPFNNFRIIFNFHIIRHYTFTSSNSILFSIISGSIGNRRWNATTSELPRRTERLHDRAKMQYDLDVLQRVMQGTRWVLLRQSHGLFFSRMRCIMWRTCDIYMNFYRVKIIIFHGIPDCWKYYLIAIPLELAFNVTI